MPIYMKIDGIDGNVSTFKYENSFEISSFSIDSEIPVSTGGGGGGGVGRAQFHPLVITMQSGKGTANIFLSLCQGQRIGKVQIWILTNSGDGQLASQRQYIFESVVFTNQAISCASGEMPTQTLQMQFTKQTIRIPANVVGGNHDEVHFWDVSKNQGG